jgi:hypothetical protein
MARCVFLAPESWSAPSLLLDANEIMQFWVSAVCCTVLTLPQVHLTCLCDFRTCFFMSHI